MTTKTPALVALTALTAAANLTDDQRAAVRDAAAELESARHTVKTLRHRAGWIGREVRQWVVNDGHDIDEALDMTAYADSVTSDDPTEWLEELMDAADEIEEARAASIESSYGPESLDDLWDVKGLPDHFRRVIDAMFDDVNWRAIAKSAADREALEAVGEAATGALDFDDLLAAHPDEPPAYWRQWAVALTLAGGGQWSERAADEARARILRAFEDAATAAAEEDEEAEAAPDLSDLNAELAETEARRGHRLSWFAFPVTPARIEEGRATRKDLKRIARRLSSEIDAAPPQVKADAKNLDPRALAEALRLANRRR